MIQNFRSRLSMVVKHQSKRIIKCNNKKVVPKNYRIKNTFNPNYFTKMLDHFHFLQF